MNKTVEDAADEYAKYSPVPRAAFSDIGYPADEAEFSAMDGFGVIMVTTLSQQQDELPPKRVYVHVNGKELELRLATGSFASVSGSKHVQDVLGKYRWDGLYYYPVYLSATATDLAVDFAKNRSGFVLIDMKKAAPPLPDFLHGAVKHPKGDVPDPNAVLKLVSREYPGFMTAP